MQERDSEVAVSIGMIRIETNGCLKLADRAGVAAGTCQCQCQVVVSVRVPRSQSTARFRRGPPQYHRDPPTRFRAPEHIARSSDRDAWLPSAVRPPPAVFLLPLQRESVVIASFREIGTRSHHLSQQASLAFEIPSLATTRGQQIARGHEIVAKSKRLVELGHRCIGLPEPVVSECEMVMSFRKIGNKLERRYGTARSLHRVCRPAPERRRARRTSAPARCRASGGCPASKTTAPARTRARGPAHCEPARIMCCRPPFVNCSLSSALALLTLANNSLARAVSPLRW